MQNIKIEKLDDYGRGICFINDKITFIKNALPNEVVNINITKENKKYNEGIVTKYLEYSQKRLTPSCPYFNSCGGCKLMNMSYEGTLLFKKEKLQNIFHKFTNIDLDIEIIPSKNILHYRNKITLKVVNGKYGYYEENTHKLINIKECLLAEPAISSFFKDLNYLNIKNGELIIRSNYNNELLIHIISKEDINPDINYLKEQHKIVGIIHNKKTIYGEDSFIEIINKKLFKVSYDSFFQINRDICSELFNITKEYISNEDNVLDLYCGVGTLGLNIADKCNKLYGIEIVKNAILNAITNAKINKKDNAFYLLGDVPKCLPKIKDEIDLVIVDPPRAGLDNITKQYLQDILPNKIIYISCDPITLARDLKELLNNYEIKLIKGLDMFPYTYHCETICVLERK